jgi:hypothetical protein
VQHDGGDRRCLVAHRLPTIRRVIFNASTPAISPQPTRTRPAFAGPTRQSFRALTHGRGSSRKGEQAGAAPSHSIIALLAKTMTLTVMTSIISIHK